MSAAKHGFKDAVLKFVMAGGGTGGHLFPAIALAHELKARDAGAEITFVGAKGAFEENIVPRHGFPLMLLNVEGVKGRRGLKRALAVIKALGATARAFLILRAIRPDGVIGSGSYASLPVVAAARLLGIKTAVLEQNALPGLTNRALGRFVDRIYASFDESRAFFPHRRVALSGNPVRREILRAVEEREERPAGRFTILVFGGSQGAKAINAAFLDASEYLSDIWPRLRVIHQTGKDGYEAAVAAYRRKELKAEVHEFIDDMAVVYRDADLVLCRAGATSIAEITAMGLPSIQVPYPFAADNHQEFNARSLERKGAAVVIRQDKLTGLRLADEIRRLYKNPDELKKMASRSKGLGRPGAASDIADDFIGLLSAGQGA